MLRETDLTVEAVGFDCGFDSPPSFYKCFKEHFGMSPARYRVEKVKCHSIKMNYSRFFTTNYF